MNIPHSDSSYGKVTISLGVAAFDKETDSKALVKAADGALYSAKKAGKNRVVS